MCIRDSVGPNGAAAIGAIAADEENLLAIHRRSLAEPGHEGDALDAALILDPLLVSRGPIDHDIAILDQALAAAPADHPRRLASLESRANAMRYVRLDEARAAYEELGRAARAAGCEQMIGRALSGQGAICLLYTSDAADERSSVDL